MKRAAYNRDPALRPLIDLASRPLGVTAEDASHVLGIPERTASSRLGKLERYGRLKKIKDTPATYVVAEGNSPGAKARIYDRLYTRGPSTLAELTETTGIGSSKTLGVLSAMQRAGIVVALKDTKPQRYKLAQQPDADSPGLALHIAWYGISPEAFSGR